MGGGVPCIARCLALPGLLLTICQELTLTHIHTPVVTLQISPNAPWGELGKSTGSSDEQNIAGENLIFIIGRICLQ